jgi:glutaredoxin
MLSVYIKPGCPYCEYTTDTISKLPLDQNKINIVSLQTEDQRDKFKSQFKKKTFPQIYFKKQSIGGNDDFQKIVKFCKESEKTAELYKNLKKKYNLEKINNLYQSANQIELQHQELLQKYSSNMIKQFCNSISSTNTIKLSNRKTKNKKHSNN